MIIVVVRCHNDDDDGDDVQKQRWCKHQSRKLHLPKGINDFPTMFPEPSRHMGAFVEEYLMHVGAAHEMSCYFCCIFTRLK